MCFCLSGCMVNWWTNRSPLAFSFTALYPVFFRQDGNCLVDFLYIVFFNWVTGVEYSLNLFAVSLSDLLFLLFGFLSYSLITYTPVWISACPSPCCPLPHIFPCSWLFVWLLGYALLTHCDSSALWTPCLPTDDHMLPQHSSGKLLFYALNVRIMMFACCSQKSPTVLPAGNFQIFEANLNLRPVFSLMTLLFTLTTVWQSSKL